jgi:PAS domain S-box-containing protein
LELLKEKRNYDSIRQGFVRGNVHKDDIDGIVSLYERFHTTYYIHRAFKIWSTGDSLLLPKLISLAESLHLEKNSAHPSQEKIDFLMARIDPINQQMTRLEDDFSNILGEGSRWLEALILKILFAIALCVEIIGFALTIYLKKGITKGLNEINTVAHEISLGDYSRRATVFSNDEIGKVAKSINKMTEDLLSQANNLQQNEQRLELVLKAAQLGIWEIDFENNTVWRNLKYDEIFGYTSLQQKWSWRIFLAHVIDEDRRMVWAHFKRARQMGYYNLECRIRGADNLPRWILIEGQAYLNAQNNIVKMAGIVMDISKRKNIEEKVLQSNKEIEQFAFAASHDLQEPLRSISNFTDLLQKPSPALYSEGQRPNEKTGA